MKGLLHRHLKVGIHGSKKNDSWLKPLQKLEMVICPEFDFLQ